MAQVGHLSVYAGPMGSGKTTRAVGQSAILSSLHCDKRLRVVYVNSSIDDRILEGGVEGVFSCHNSSVKHISDKVDTLKCLELSSVNFDQYDVVIIDEAQFFSDLVDSVLNLIKKGKMVQVYGLASDYNKRKFGSIMDLLSFADVFSQLRAQCTDCLANRDVVDAAFTYKRNIQPNSNVVEVSGFDVYIPLCGKCYSIRQSKDLTEENTQ